MKKPHKLDVCIQIDVMAWMKWLYWVEIAQGEVSGLGVVEEHPGLLRITDFVLLEQVCSDAETELDPRAIAELMQDIDDPSRLRCWIHSHADMGVFWSRTDESTIAGLSNGTWLLSMVVNKAHQSLLRLDQFNPTHMYIDNVQWQLYFDAAKKDQSKWKKQFSDRVQEYPMVSLGLRQAYDPRLVTEEEFQEEMEVFGWEEM